MNNSFVVHNLSDQLFQLLCTDCYSRSVHVPFR